MSFKEHCKNSTVNTSETETVKGHYDEVKDWKMDEKGYFLIRINKEKNRVEVGFCPEINKVTVTITGDKPQDIYYEVCKRELVSRLDHAAYLGKELEKAFFALRNKLEYEQDEVLEVK